MPTDRDDRADEEARTKARREVDIYLTHARTVFTPDMALELMKTVGTIDKNLAVVCSQVKNLEHTLSDGKCKDHEAAIGTLKTFMDSIKGQVRVLGWVSATALVIAGLVLNSMHSQTKDLEAFHVAVQAGQMKSAAKQTVMQETLDAADVTAKHDKAQAKAQRDAMQATQAEGATVIYREYRKMRAAN